MAASSVFQSTYLTPGAPNAITGPERFRVAGALYQLQEQLRGGAPAATAQAFTYAGQKRHRDAINAGKLRTPAGNTMQTDFQAIDSL